MIDLPPSLFRGAYTPLLTPFKDGAVDHAGYAGLIEFQITRGADGLVIAGTSGEPFSLSVTERKALLETAVAAAAGRVPLIAATGAFSLADTLELTRHAAHAGAHAAMVLAPPFAKPSQEGLVAYFTAVGERCDLPMFLYQIPSRTHAKVEIDSLLRIAEAVPHLIGMKQSDDDRPFVQAAAKALGPQFRTFMGLSEIAWDMLGKGACGLIVALGNLVPDEIMRLAQLGAAGKIMLATQAHARLKPLNTAAFLQTNPVPIKYMAARLGLIPSGEHRLPLTPPPADIAAQLDAALRAARLV